MNDEKHVDEHTTNIRKFFSKQLFAGCTVIIQIAGQKTNERSNRPGLCLGDLSHVYALVRISSWTSCLHVLIYTTTLIYIISNLLRGSFLALFTRQHHARVADVNQANDSVRALRQNNRRTREDL